MTLDLERQLRDYTALLDETLPEISPADVIDSTDRHTIPTRSVRVPALAWAAIAAALTLVVLLPLLLSDGGADSDVVTTIPVTVPETTVPAPTIPDLAPTGLGRVADLPSAHDVGWRWIPIEFQEGLPLNPYGDAPSVSQLPDGSWVLWQRVGQCLLPDGSFAGPNRDGSSECRGDGVEVGPVFASMWSTDLVTWTHTDRLVVGGYYGDALFRSGIGRRLDPDGASGWMRLDSGRWVPVPELDRALEGLDPWRVEIEPGQTVTLVVVETGDERFEMWFTPGLEGLVLDEGPIGSGHAEYAAVGDRWYRLEWPSAGVPELWTAIEPAEWVTVDGLTGLPDVTEAVSTYASLQVALDRLVLTVSIDGRESPSREVSDAVLVYASETGFDWQMVEFPTTVTDGDPWAFVNGSDDWLAVFVNGAPALTSDLSSWYRLHSPEGVIGGPSLANGWGPYEGVSAGSGGVVNLATWDTDDSLEWPPVLWPIWVAVPPG